MRHGTNFKYIVLITKYHDGFHMWDTAESDFKITNTPFGRDIARKMVDACHAAGMPIGFYYSQRDWYHPGYMPVDPDKVTQKEVWWTLKEGYESPLGERHAKYLEYQERLDLGCERMATGVRVEYYANRQKRMTVRACTSVDGEEWTDCGEIVQPFGEVPVNGYRAGAAIPGKPTRYVMSSYAESYFLSVGLT